MRIALAAVVGLLLVVPAAAVGGSGSQSPRSTLLTQAQLLREGRFRVMYEKTYTPRFRAKCPWAKYVRRQRFGRRYLGPGFKLREIRTRMLSSTRAILAYRFVRANGQTAAKVTFRDRDLYVKAGGRWLDEYDSVSDC